MRIIEDATVSDFDRVGTRVPQVLGMHSFRSIFQNLYCHVKVVNLLNACNLLNFNSSCSNGQPFTAHRAVVINMIVNLLLQ